MAESDHVVDLFDPEGCSTAAGRAWELMERLFPICRSITGDGVRATLRELACLVPVQTREVPSGVQAFDWVVPREWNIREAWIKDPAGRTVVDFRDHSLHVVSYSVPVKMKMTLAELRPHLYSLPDHPDWIPYRTSYYRESWGFCLADRVLQGLVEGQYEVHIDSSLRPGSLTYGELLVPGESADEFLVFTHICHPSLCNDNLSGIGLAVELATHLKSRRNRLTYRFVFAPGTIGSIVWLSRNEPVLNRIQCGFVLGLLGDDAPLTYKRSRRGNSLIDQAAEYCLPGLERDARLVDFTPYGYDERQLCSPGFDLPVGRLTRSENGGYPEYHTSADNFSVVSRKQLARSLAACARLMRIADRNAYYINLSPKCEPMLGKRGLYRNTGGQNPGQFEHALLWVLNQSDGSNSLLDIARTSGLDFELLTQAADALLEGGLLAATKVPHAAP